MQYYNSLRDLCEGYENFYQFGRAVYKHTPCGPWCQLVTKDGKKIYYESTEANDPKLFDSEDVIGLNIGSIVEGSEVEVGPIFLSFPILEDDVWEAIESIDEEASFYWERDNINSYIIEDVDRSYVLDGDVWDEDTPDEIRDIFERSEADQLDEGEELEIEECIIHRVDKSMMFF